LPCHEAELTLGKHILNVKADILNILEHVLKHEGHPVESPYIVEWVFEVDVIHHIRGQITQGFWRQRFQIKPVLVV